MLISTYRFGGPTSRTGHCRQCCPDNCPIDRDTLLPPVSDAGQLWRQRSLLWSSCTCPCLSFPTDSATSVPCWHPQPVLFAATSWQSLVLECAIHSLIHRSFAPQRSARGIMAEHPVASHRVEAAGAGATVGVRGARGTTLREADAPAQLPGPTSEKVDGAAVASGERARAATG